MLNIVYQDYLKAIKEADEAEFIQRAVRQYKNSDIYLMAKEGEAYFSGNNTGIISNTAKGITLKSGEKLKMSEPVTSNIFRQLVIQQNATLLSNGAQIKDKEGADLKHKFGIGFDRTMAQLGENALKHGVSYGYWNYNRLLVFTALEFFTLDDERSGIPMVGIRFWERTSDANQTIIFIEFYENDGVTEYTIKGGEIKEESAKSPYGVTVRPVTNTVESVKKYTQLPIIPFWGNSEHTSELTKSIKTKIDFLDEVWTNFRDSASRINIIYWIIKNFNLTPGNSLELINQIKEIGIISEFDDKFSAEPHAFEIPSASVKEAAEMIENAIYKDFMGVNMREITGGSLTNVAVNTAFDNLMKKVARYEWQPFQFIQSLMQVIGISVTEDIQFKREVPRNAKEETDMILSAADHLDKQTIVEKLPFVTVDEVSVILERKADEISKEDLILLQSLQSSGIISAEEIRAYFEKYSDTFKTITSEMINKARENLPDAFEGEHD